VNENTREDTLYGGGTYGVRAIILTSTISSFMEKFLWAI
jgi:hypothetical protein